MHASDKHSSLFCLFVSDDKKVSKHFLQDTVPYPDADYVRTPSPEHVGIPAGPLRIPIRNKQSGADEYTSDDSNEISFGASRSRSRHPPQNRRKKSVQQFWNPFF